MVSSKQLVKEEIKIIEVGFYSPSRIELAWQEIYVDDQAPPLQVISQCMPILSKIPVTKEKVSDYISLTLILT